MPLTCAGVIALIVCGFAGLVVVLSVPMPGTESWKRHAATVNRTSSVPLPLAMEKLNRGRHKSWQATYRAPPPTTTNATHLCYGQCCDSLWHGSCGRDADWPHARQQISAPTAVGTAAVAATASRPGDLTAKGKSWSAKCRCRARLPLLHPMPPPSQSQHPLLHPMPRANSTTKGTGYLITLAMLDSGWCLRHVCDCAALPIR